MITSRASAPISRREAVSSLVLGTLGLSAGCSLGPAAPEPEVRTGRLLSRPGAGGLVPPVGLHSLNLATPRDALLYVPPNLSTDVAPSFLLILHGNPQSASEVVPWYAPLADEFGVVMLAPDSRQITWDIVFNDYGPDVDFIDSALSWYFRRYRVDPARIGVLGFSDGGTYSLAMGLSNGDLFRRVAALSPGFLAPHDPTVKPPVYLSHGTQDSVLPIGTTSRKILETLTTEGYSVTFREFSGGHVLPAPIAREAFRWAAGGELNPVAASGVATR